MTRLNDDGKTYNQHDAAFRDIWAGVVMKGGERVATIAIKIGGRSSPNGLTVTAYVHVIGLSMVKGIARGGGYDMKSAAILSACSKIRDKKLSHDPRLQGDDMHSIALNELAAKFRGLTEGHDVPHQLRAMGYEFFQAV